MKRAIKETLADLAEVAVAGGLAVAVSLFAAVSLCGCKNTGVSLVVGEQMLLPEITDSGDNLAIRLYEDVKGARVWSAKNSIVRTEYTCTTTNSYFGVVETQSAMTLNVAVEPCDINSSTSTTEIKNKE